MHPVLFKIGDFEIYTYGPIMAAGFLSAFLLMYHVAKMKDDDLDFYMDLFIWIIVFGVLGAMILYNILDWRRFIEDPIRSMNPRNGGLVWYGGVIAAGSFVVWYSRRKGKRVLQVTDTLSAPLALGLAVGRWGCLMGGCCYGAPTSLPWGIHYPETHPTGGVAVHPAPLYESAASLLIAAVVYTAIRKKARQGVPTLLYFTIYPVVRILIELVRGDEVRGFVYRGETIGVSTSQFIGFLILLAAAYFWMRILRRPAK